MRASTIITRIAKKRKKFFAGEKIAAERSSFFAENLFFYFVNGTTTKNQRGDLNERLRGVKLYVEKRDGEDMQDDGADDVRRAGASRTDGVNGGYRIKNKRDRAYRAESGDRLHKRIMVPVRHERSGHFTFDPVSYVIAETGAEDRMRQKLFPTHLPQFETMVVGEFSVDHDGKELFDRVHFQDHNGNGSADKNKERYDPPRFLFALCDTDHGKDDAKDARHEKGRARIGQGDQSYGGNHRDQP